MENNRHHVEAIKKLQWLSVILRKKTLWLVPLIFLFFSNTTSAQNIDVRILESINPRDPNSSYWKTTSLSAYVFSGAITVAPFIYGLASDNEKAKHQSYEIMMGMGINVIFMEALKKSINRERPGDRYPDLIFPSSQVHGQSFPSGHTSLAFATATELTLEYKKWYIVVPAYLWAGSVGYSRLYLGKHYPTDVFGGAVLGAGSAYASVWLNKKLFKSYYKNLQKHE